MRKINSFLLRQRDNITKGKSDHVTVLTSEEAFRLARLLLDEVALDQFGVLTCTSSA